MGNNKLNAALPPTLHTTSLGHPGKPHDSTLGLGTPKSHSQPTDASADAEDVIGTIPPTLYTRSSVHFVLGNFFIATFLISLIIFTVFFTVNWVILRDARLLNHRVFSNSTGLSILGDGLQVDLEASALSISWKVLACGVDKTPGGPFWDARIPARCGPFDGALDVYLNEYVRILSPAPLLAPVHTSARCLPMDSSVSKPIFSSIPHTELMNKRMGIWDPPRFTVEHQFNKYVQGDPTENSMVPFQHYVFDAFAFAVDPTTNHSVHIANFGVLGTLGDFVVHSHDRADTSEFTNDSGNGLVTTEIESRLLRVEITRSMIAKAFAICLFLVNWTLTVGSVYITALVASRMLEANSMIAALPFSAPLTIPMLRSLYLYSPPSGTSIDTTAFLVQIVIVGLCSLILFGVLTSRRPPPSPPSKFSV